MRKLLPIHLGAPMLHSSASIYLFIAIVLEVIATSALKASNSFTRLIPTLIVIAGYAGAFWFLSLTLRSMPVGIAYAIWSGVGIVLISLVGWLWFKQSLDWPAILGMALIVAGVLTINLFSKISSH
jgi:small multidrug resistance pump